MRACIHALTNQSTACESSFHGTASLTFPRAGPKYWGTDESEQGL